MDTFTKAYIDAALFSSGPNVTENDDRSFERMNYGIDDLADEARTQIEEDCRAFQETYREHIGNREERAGHDFWFTRNHDGVGFWDGDWEEPAATILTDACEAYGTVDLYLGDDGLIYIV